MRYILYLMIYIPIQLFAYLVTPILPIFATQRYGSLDNASTYGLAFRLPKYLSWFDTPDNSLGRDGNYLREYGDNYISRVGGLYRNSLYGFKWNILAMPIQKTDREIKIVGRDIDYHTKSFGSIKIKQKNGAWQYKLVKPIFNRILILNIGWLLDDMSQEKALFMFSPRLKKF